MKEAESQAAVRDMILARALDSVDVDLPERLVDEETDRRVRNAEERATRAGITLQDALAAQGWDELRFRSDARGHAVRALKADLLLEAVSRQENLEVTQEDLESEIQSLAQASGRDVREVRRILERSGQVRSLAGDIIRTKALDLLVESADVASEETSGHQESPILQEQKDGDE
jgi:trigger factor